MVFGNIWINEREIKQIVENENNNNEIYKPPNININDSMSRVFIGK